MTFNSSIYTGWVMHSRRSPRTHTFRYRVWWMLLDLDELSAVDGALSLFSHNRFNLFSLHDRDYGHGHGTLRTYVEERLREARLAHAGTRIELLTMPRLCGYAFNPLSIYFCHDEAGRVAAVIYEVHNTFGERHSYVIEATDDRSGTISQSIQKAFYVSPFLNMDLSYRFRVRAPSDDVAVAITGLETANAPVIHTALHGKRMRLTSASLLRRWISHPLLTLKVIGAIHWEALKIFGKGIRIRTRRPVSGHEATIQHQTTHFQGDHG